MIKKRIISMASVVFLLVAFLSSTSRDVYAGSKRNEERKTLIFYSPEKPCCPMFTSIEVFLSTKEDYYLVNGKAKYYYRSIYSYGKVVLSNAGAISEFKVIPIKHYNSADKLLKKFEWECEDNIFPEAEYIAGVGNSSVVYYAKDTSNYGKCTVSVSVDYAIPPVKLLDSSYSLFVSAK